MSATEHLHPQSKSICFPPINRLSAGATAQDVSHLAKESTKRFSHLHSCYTALCTTPTRHLITYARRTHLVNDIAGSEPNQIWCTTLNVTRRELVFDGEKVHFPFFSLFVSIFLLENRYNWSHRLVWSRFVVAGHFLWVSDK